MNNLIIIIFITIFFMINSGYSQEQLNESLPGTEINDIKVTHFSGISASSFSGAGVSYMYYITPNYHFKITGIYYRNRDEKTNGTDQKAFNDTIFANGGLELRRNFAVVKKLNTTFQFYTVAGGAYWYYKKERPFSPEDDKKLKLISSGIGIGTGFLFINRILVNIDLAYQYTTGIHYGLRRTGIGAGISCYIAF